jgi:hypothetical protein
MKTYLLPFLLLLLGFSGSQDATAGEVTDYLVQYRQHAIADYARETKIISGYSLKKLIEELQPFYSDTLSIARQKAYYLTYKKGLQTPSGEQALAVTRLVEGLGDASGGLAGQVIGYLQAFLPAAFTPEAQSVIISKLRNTRTPHYGDLALLAGFIGTGKEALYQQYLKAGLPVKEKWNIALALARMGKAEEIEYCVKKIKTLPVNSEMIGYALPDLIYIRQKQAIDYCVELLYSDEKLCRSPNPDFSEPIPCAYRIMEQLAPVIVGFPVQVDVTGTLDTGDYPKALQKVRAWFSENTGYEIKTTTY